MVSAPAYPISSQVRTRIPSRTPRGHGELGRGAPGWPGRAVAAGPRVRPLAQTSTPNARTADAAGTSGSLTKAAQQQALAGGAVSGALRSPEFSSLVSTAQSAANVPDYCGLLLDLPQLPQPAQLTQLPVSLLSQLLTQVPTATLAQQLTSLPSSTLSALLAELPVSTVSQILPHCRARRWRRS